MVRADLVRTCSGVPGHLRGGRPARLDKTLEAQLSIEEQVDELCDAVNDLSTTVRNTGVEICNHVLILAAVILLVDAVFPFFVWLVG